MKKQWFILCFILFSTKTLLAQNNDDTLATNLIQLRGQVEDLQSELKILKAEHTSSMSYLNTRKTELQSNIDRKQLHIKQSIIEIEELQKQVKLLGANSEQLIEPVIKLLNQSKETIHYGIPFKPTERLTILEDIERKLVARKITSQNAINQLWAFIEDEIRLTRENAIYSQTILLDGENALVDIAKIGTVMMYFKTHDEKFGLAKKIDQQWHYEKIKSTKNSQYVANLFDSLSKQIRQGYFQLPLALNSGEQK